MRFIYSNKKISTLVLALFLSASLRAQEKTVQVTKTDNDRISGEFLGTYMDHIHLLVNNKLVYVHCQDLISVRKGGSDFPYNCSENTVTPEVLFPFKFDPMTGKIVQTIPNVFRKRSLSKNIKNSVLSKPAQNKTKTNENTFITRAEVKELINSEVKDQVKLEISNQLAQKQNTQIFINKKKDQNNIFVKEGAFKSLFTISVAYISFVLFVSLFG